MKWLLIVSPTGHKNCEKWNFFTIALVEITPRPNFKGLHASQEVWLATVWSLWISRNKLIFEGKDVSKNDVLSNVKLLSWSWFIYRAAHVLFFVMTLFPCLEVYTFFALLCCCAAI
ncbi:hypothetical protein P8452_54403 [Trifolium repens]|nr:hypothetical protein P8452_54403 [Trifolium repens]